MTQPLDRNKTYIQDILNAINLCFSFTQGMTFESFEKDLKTISAVQHQILIIGEATKRLTLEFRNQHPNIPWKAMAGMRDILIHSYKYADIERVAKKYNLKIIENLGSHGVGRALHEEPGFIAPFFDPKDKRKLKLGQVITIEPFLSTRSSLAVECRDGWTLTTDKGNFAAQFEHSMIITKKYPIILTHA